MKKRYRSIVWVIISIFFAMGILGGCDTDDENETDNELHWSQNNPYHIAVIYNSLKHSFLYAEENRINVAYKNENYDPSDPDSEEYYFDGNLPSDRIIFLTEQAQLKDAFEEVPDIDLDTKMVMILLTQTFGDTLLRIENITIEDGVLEIIMGEKYGQQTTEPFLIDSVFTLDKVDITDTKVTFIRL